MLIFTAYFVQKIAMMTYEDSGDGAGRIGKCALVLTLVDPALVISEFSVLTEVLYTFLIVAAIYLAFEFRRNGRWYCVTAAGVLFVLSAYVRPIGVYLGYVIFGVLLLSCLRARNTRAALIVLSVLAMQYGAVEAWKQKNRAVYGERIISTSASAELYHYIAAAVVACADGRHYADVQKEFEEDVVSENPAVQAKHDIEKGAAIVFKHPLWSAYIGFKGLLVNMFDPGTAILANKFGLRKSESGLIYKFHDMGLGDFIRYLWESERYFLFFTAIGGVWIVSAWVFLVLGVMHGKRMDLYHWLLLTTIAYYIILAAGPGAHAKYRVPSIPAINVFVASGIVVAYDRLILRLGKRGGTRKPA